MSSNNGTANIHLRPAEGKDVEALSALCTELGYTRSPKDIHAWLLNLQHQGVEQTAFVACVEDQPIGWIEVSVVRLLQSSPCAFIGGLVVGTSMRSCGVGRLLCFRAESWALERGLSGTKLTSNQSRLDAHGFYQREGYTHTKTSFLFSKDISPV